MKQSMHINESLPVTITYVTVNRKSTKKGGKELCVDTMIMLDISHVKFHQPGPSSLPTLDLNANVNAKMSKSFKQK